MATNPAKPTGRRGAKAHTALAEAIGTKPVFPYPYDLDDKFKDIWRDTVNTKTGDYWSLGDVPLLKMYCRMAHDIHRLSEEIEAEGEVIINANGNPVVNPRIVIRGYAEAKFMSLCTKLRLQPSSRMDTKGEDNQLKRKVKAKRAADVIEADEDELLASGGSMMQ
jgi:P27 family predicted phage terminase small subunit